MAAPPGSAARASDGLQPQQPPKKKVGSGGGADDGSGRQRKPYVMSKPRETWTDAEHSLFIEALKLYTRDWKKIQQHVKTKTAVQIRSHAQKHFQKLIKNGQRHEVPDARAKRPSGSVNKGKRRRSAQLPLAADATAGSAALPPLRASAPGGAAMRRVSSACAGSGDDIGSCSGSAQSPEAAQDGSGLPVRKSRRTAARAAPQREPDSDSDSEAEAAADARAAAAPACGLRQPPAMGAAPAAEAARQPGPPAAHSPTLDRNPASGQGPTPPHWPSHGFGGFATGSGAEQCMRTAAAVTATADYRYPSVPLPHQAFYPGPPGYPVWQQMCDDAAAPKATDGGCYPSGWMRYSTAGSGSGLRSGSGSGLPTSGSGPHSSGGVGGDAVVPSMSPAAPPVQGGQHDSIWAEEAEAVTNPAAMQEPPNFREMYGFIGNLFDESCRGNDHAAVLAGMSAATRSEAGRCLQRLLNNMQAPVWEGRTLAQKTSQASSQTAC